MAKHIELGKFGEEKAIEYLMKKQYKIIKKNYWQKSGCCRPATG